MSQSQEALPQAAKQWMAIYHHDEDDENFEAALKALRLLMARTFRESEQSSPEPS